MIICDTKLTVLLQEDDAPCSSVSSTRAQQQRELQELKEEADLYRSRLAECRSQGDELIAQRNGDNPASCCSN